MSTEQTSADASSLSLPDSAGSSLSSAPSPPQAPAAAEPVAQQALVLCKFSRLGQCSRPVKATAPGSRGRRYEYCDAEGHNPVTFNRARGAASRAEQAVSVSASATASAATATGASGVGGVAGPASAEVTAGSTITGPGAFALPVSAARAGFEASGASVAVTLRQLGAQVDLWLERAEAITDPENVETQIRAVTLDAAARVTAAQQVAAAEAARRAEAERVGQVAVACADQAEADARVARDALDTAVTHHEQQLARIRAEAQGEVEQVRAEAQAALAVAREQARADGEVARRAVAEAAAEAARAREEAARREEAAARHGELVERAAAVKVETAEQMAAAQVAVARAEQETARAQAGAAVKMVEAVSANAEKLVEQERSRAEREAVARQAEAERAGRAEAERGVLAERLRDLQERVDQLGAALGREQDARRLADLEVAGLRGERAAAERAAVRQEQAAVRDGAQVPEARGGQAGTVPA